MLPLVAASIAAGASLLGSKAQADAAVDTNNANIALMRESWARDDSSIQRKVADLKAAGLHPSLAAGGGMSSQPVRLETPLRENPIEKMVQSAQRSADVAMSNVQQKIMEAQYLKELYGAKIEKKKSEIFDETGILPGQEPSFMGMKLPAGWMGSVSKDFNRKVSEDAKMRESLKKLREAARRTGSL